MGFIAAIIGDNIGFAIGHFGGRALALRWGKYVFLTEERLDKAERFFDRRGAIVITFARFVEGLRQANGIIAGITGMHWLRFLVFNAIGAALWVGTWVSLGYLAGGNITTIYHYITLYSYYVLIALVGAARRLCHLARAAPAPAPPHAGRGHPSRRKGRDQKDRTSRGDRAGRAGRGAAHRGSSRTGHVVTLQGSQLPRGGVRHPETALGQRRVRGHRDGRAEHRAHFGDDIGEVLPVQAQDGRTAIRHQTGEQAPERVNPVRSG